MAFWHTPPRPDEEMSPPARGAVLTPEERRVIATRAAIARWRLVAGAPGWKAPGPQKDRSAPHSGGFGANRHGVGG